MLSWSSTAAHAVLTF